MKYKKDSPIPVIYYHSVALKKNTKWQFGFLTLGLKYFEDQLKYFVRNKYRSIFLDEYYANRKGDVLLDDKTICLTFDDGYLDNWVYVFPLLKKYNLKATIFVNPDFVDKKNKLRNNLEDYWNGKKTINEINKWGFLSWGEMKLMEDSGLIDIQAHTMTHTKYFISDKLNGFHHPGSRRIYPLWNSFPSIKPYYIQNKDFERILPYGYPLFEEASAIVARRVFINNDFNDEVIEACKKMEWKNYNFKNTLKRIKPIYEEYYKKNKLIIKRESEQEYLHRLNYEIVISKQIIEEKLKRKINFCSWPNGDNNKLAHKIAIECGYMATTIGNLEEVSKDYERIDGRIGTSQVRNSRILTLMKAIYKIKSYQQINPYYTIKKIYYKKKYGKKI